MSIKFFADTANHKELEYCFERGVNDGITTNPMIMQSTGDLSIGFHEACKSILDKSPDAPVSLETDLRGADVSELDNYPHKVRDILLQQAYELVRLGKNVVVKIPICEGGLLATTILSGQGIKTNVTACMTPYQALAASEAGATYVSLFANRILDSHLLDISGHSLDVILTDPAWKQKVKVAVEVHFHDAWQRTLTQISYVASTLDGTNCSLIVGSIRSPEDIVKIVRACPQVITIPAKIVKGLSDIRGLKQTPRTQGVEEVILGDSLRHPMTQYTLAEFEKAADSYRKK